MTLQPNKLTNLPNKGFNKQSVTNEQTNQTIKCPFNPAWNPTQWKIINLYILENMNQLFSLNLGRANFATFV